MIKLRVEGQFNQVQSFLQDIRRCPSIELDVQDHLTNWKETIQVVASCTVQYLPDRRFQIIEMTTSDGSTIQIPLADVMQVKFDEGITMVFGKSIDVFS